MDGEQEPALVFSENQDVNLRFSAPDGFRFTMDGLDIFNADGEQDEEGQTWLTPQGGRVFSLFEGQNFPLVPGYYIMTVTGEGKSWYSLVEVTPRFLEKESWKDMKKELTKEIRHLSFDFMCRHVHMDRYHGNLAGMDSRMLLRFYIIEDMFPQVFRALEELAHTAIEREFMLAKLNLLEHARKKTTQKVNLFEKVQIPGYQDALRKIKRFMEDEENLSKSSQKIMKSHQEKRKEVEA